MKMQSMRLYASKLYIENDSFENLIITAIACIVLKYYQIEKFDLVDEQYSVYLFLKINSVSLISFKGIKCMT